MSLKSLSEKLAMFWEATGKSKDADTHAEILKLARLLLTVVSGIVADERVFSALEFVKNSRRNCLQGEHLQICVRMKSQNLFTLKNFSHFIKCDRVGARRVPGESLSSVFCFVIN